MNGISKIIKSCVFLCILGLLCGSLIGFVNELTKDKIGESEYNKSFEEVIKSGITKESIKELEIDNKVEGITNIYRGLSIDGIPCYAFNVENKNEYTTVKVIIVIEIATEDILNVRVLPGSTTHQYDNKMSESKFGVAGLPIYDFEQHFEIVTGATSSSNSVKKCLEAVKQQIAQLGSNVTFKELEQRIPDINMFEYTFETENGEFLPFIGVYGYTNQRSNYVQSGRELYKELKPKYICIKTVQYFGERNLDFKVDYFKQDLTKLSDSFTSNPNVGDEIEDNVINNNPVVYVAIGCGVAIIATFVIVVVVYFFKKKEQTVVNAEESDEKAENKE